MRKINTLLIIIFVLTSFIAKAGTNPAFIVEEENKTLTVYLQFEDASSYLAVFVESQCYIKGAIQTEKIEISGHDLEVFNKNMVKIQSLENGCNFASYKLEAVDSEGEVWRYPIVSVPNSVEKMALALKE